MVFSVKMKQRSALLVAFQIVGALLDHIGRRAVCVLLEHLTAHCRKAQRAERCFIFTEKTIAEGYVINGRAFVDYILHAEDIEKA